MPSYKAQAIVLKKTKLGETDAIITMLSSAGQQLRGVGKGARKPGSKIGARLELYSIVDLMMHTGRSLDIITEVRTIADNAACRSDIEHSAAAAVVVEMAEKATRDSEAESLLFEMSKAALLTIGQSTGTGLAIQFIAAAYLLKVCSVIGYRPIQSEMEQSPYKDPQIISWVAKLLASRFIELAEFDDQKYSAVIDALLEFSQYWLQQHLEFSLKSLDFIIKGSLKKLI